MSGDELPFGTTLPSPRGRGMNGTGATCNSVHGSSKLMFIMWLHIMGLYGLFCFALM